MENETKINKIYQQLTDDLTESLNLYLTVSPLGPLREAYEQAGASIFRMEEGVIRMDKPAEITDNLASITFEMLPMDERLFFVVKEVKNIKDSNDLPPTYMNGKASFFMTPGVHGGKPTELCIHTQDRTKWIKIGITKINSHDLQWIIKTMKRAGKEFTALNKKIAKINEKAGRTFTIKI